MENIYLDKLNKNQKEAASCIDQNVRIIAGAGSGKTRVLMARIAYLIRTCGILPFRVMAITFTNKAANEMKERLQVYLGDEARDVRVSTIHSLCVRILREDADKIDYPKSFSILDSDDQRAILRPYYKENQIDKNMMPVSRVLGAISNYKTVQISPSEAKQKAYDQKTKLLADIYKFYQERLDEMRAMDFDDLLLQTRRLLKNSDEVREKWQNRLDYIHVDEFQDVDPIQYDLIRLITGEHALLCVVGDPDQTIYTWRGANMDIIMRFNKDFPNTKTVILNENYRSAPQILNAANALIAHNKNRIKKDLVTNLPESELIEAHESNEDKEEPLYVARQINELHAKGFDYKDMAILYRNNYSSRAFERVLRNVNIPYRIFGGIRYYERAEIKDILSYLRLLAAPDAEDPKQLSKNLSVLRVLNVPKRGIGARTVEKLQAQAQEKGINLYEVLKEPENVSKTVINKLTGFYEVIEELKKDLKEKPLEDMVDLIAQKTGYLDMLEAANEQERIENIKELKEDISQARIENPELTLEEYLQDVALFTDKAQEEGGSAVSLMTVHAAKGLEFPAVFITNFNQDVFPSRRSLDESGKAGLEEERRLFYVAMTRAKNRLFLTWNKGYSYVNDGFKTPSQFIKEIPDEFVHNESRDRINKQIQTQHANSFSIHAHKSAAKRINSSKARYRKNDILDHTVYGEGKVLEVRGNVVTIQFSDAIGVKKMNAQHPSLKKKSHSES